MVTGMCAIEEGRGHQITKEAPHPRPVYAVFVSIQCHLYGTDDNLCEMKICVDARGESCTMIASDTWKTKPSAWPNCAFLSKPKLQYYTLSCDRSGYGAISQIETRTYWC